MEGVWLILAKTEEKMVFFSFSFSSFFPLSYVFSFLFPEKKENSAMWSILKEKEPYLLGIDLSLRYLSLANSNSITPVLFSLQDIATERLFISIHQIFNI